MRQASLNTSNLALSIMQGRFRLPERVIPSSTMGRAPRNTDKIFWPQQAVQALYADEDAALASLWVVQKASGYCNGHVGFPEACPTIHRSSAREEPFGAK